MMGEPPSIEHLGKELPRWVQVIAGMVLGLFALLCGFATIDLFLIAPKPVSMVGLLAALLLLLGCLWVLEKCFRLLTGRKRARTGGLMSPNTLRIVSYFLLILPIVGLFTGYFREMGAVAVFQAVMYFFGFLGLRALARKREAEGISDDRDKE